MDMWGLLEEKSRSKYDHSLFYSSMKFLSIKKKGNKMEYVYVYSVDTDIPQLGEHL